MGCTASRHLGRHSSMERHPSPPMTPEHTSTCTMEYSVEYHQHIVALTSSSYGRLKVPRPSESRDLRNHGTSRVSSLNEMYSKLISLETSHEPVNLQALCNTLHSPLGRDTSCSRMLHTPPAGRETSSSPSDRHEWRINSAEFVISETINVRELMMGFEERVSPRGLLHADHASSTTTKMLPTQKDAAILRQPLKKRLEKPFHTVEEVDTLAKSGKVIQQGLDETDYESGKENNGPERGHHVRYPLDSSPLSQTSQPALMVRDAQERRCSPSIIKSSPFSSISEAKRNAAFKHGRNEPALHCTQQQRKKLASSVTPLPMSMSRRRMELKGNIISTEPSSPLFDPNMVASYEKALQYISKDNWNACLVDSPEVGDRRRASATMRNEQRDAIASGRLPKGEAKRLYDALDCFAINCPPGGDETIVLYTTTLRGIRKTFEDCNHVRRILQRYGLSFDERDVSMHLGFLNELRGLMDRVLAVPRLFIKGRYIGGVEEVGKLHEDGKLRELVEGLPRQAKRGKCEGCNGIRFVPCLECRGSCKIRCEDNKVLRCPDCNENGLIQCPICT